MLNSPGPRTSPRFQLKLGSPTYFFRKLFAKSPWPESGHCRWWIQPVRLLHPDSYWNIYDSSISITYSKNIRHSIHLTFHLVVPSWILIALIGLAPLEENMNPLFFSIKVNSSVILQMNGPFLIQKFLICLPSNITLRISWSLRILEQLYQFGTVWSRWN